MLSAAMCPPSVSSVRVLLVAEVRVREDGHLRQDVERRRDTQATLSLENTFSVRENP